MWRESRLVIMPDCQGLGLGPAISDAVAKFFIVERGGRFSRRRRARRETRERARGAGRRRGRAVDRGYGLANSWVFVYASPWGMVVRVARHLSMGIGRTSRAAASC